jgi:hypothetical protein
MTSNAEIARNPMRPSGSGGSGSACGPAAGASAALALLDDVLQHRLRRAALHLPPVALGTRCLLILGQAPSTTTLGYDKAEP